MQYHQLVDEHEAIERSARLLLDCTQCRTPHPDRAFALLGALATTVRDHVAAETPVIRNTLEAAAGERHQLVAHEVERDWRQVREDWTQYLDRWDEPQIAADWPRFAADTHTMLDRLDEQLRYETSILYSLALHYRVIAP